MDYPCWVVDAFTNRQFRGNPAAVCLLEQWPHDSLLSAIATEFNLSETAFVKQAGNHWAIRWFTPVCEVSLCGHATLAAAHVLTREQRIAQRSVTFQSASGQLSVRNDAGNRLELDFPSSPLEKYDYHADLLEALGARPSECWLATDLLCLLPSAKVVGSLKPDTEALKKLPGRGLIVTAPGDDCDFVSRFFAPKVGVSEDPVTGSAHTALTPFWAARLHKRRLRAKQISERGGELWLEDRGSRVRISGYAVTVMAGALRLPILDEFGFADHLGSR